MLPQGGHHDHGKVVLFDIVELAHPKRVSCHFYF
jgi:hypothetical protein